MFPVNPVLYDKEVSKAKIFMKNILITGASRGIGRAIAVEFARTDCNLYLNSLHGGEKLEESISVVTAVRRECGTTGSILAMRGDVGNPEFVRNMFEHLRENFERMAQGGKKAADAGPEGIPEKLPGLDVLVNNAGISYVGLLQDMTDEDWNRIIATNLSSVHYCCHEAIPMMLASGGGRIINISSVWGNVGASCEVAYSATKGGVNAYTKALAKELAPSHIAVNAVACGCIDTDMNKCFTGDERAALCEEIPAGRFADPSEVARLVHVVAEQPEYLTGQIITFDGGWQ